MQFIVNYSLQEDHHAMGHITKYFKIEGKTIYSGKKFRIHILNSISI